MSEVVDLGVRGAKVQTWRAANPRELLKRVIDDNPGADRQALLHLFREQMWREDEAEDYVDTIIDYWFANNYYSIVAPVGIARTEQHRRTLQASAQVAEKIRQRIVEQAQIMLSDMLMPNGKRLAECTGKECQSLGIAVGGWLGRVARKVKPDQAVGEALSEEQLRELYAK